MQPPERFAADHAAFLARSESYADLGAQIDDAVENENLAHVHLARAKLRGEFGLSALLDYGTEYCNRVLPETGPTGSSINPRDVFCGSKDLPGGEYGASIDLIVKTWAIQFGPLAALDVLTPGLSGEQLIIATGYVQPQITELFEEVTLELAELTPPAELSEGHNVLVQYFDELFATSNAIDGAVADGDIDRLQREFTRSGQVAETMRDRMPANYRSLVPFLLPAR